MDGRGVGLEVKRGGLGGEELAGCRVVGGRKGVACCRGRGSWKTSSRAAYLWLCRL